MMKIWLACFIAMFAVAELFQWLKGVTLPLPIYILGGAFLAIASNYGKRSGLPVSPNNANATPEERQLEQKTANGPTPLAASSAPMLQQQSSQPESQLKSYPSISFTIRKPDAPTQAAVSEDGGKGGKVKGEGEGSFEF